MWSSCVRLITISKCDRAVWGWSQFFICDQAVRDWSHVVFIVTKLTQTDHFHKCDQAVWDWSWWTRWVWSIWVNLITFGHVIDLLCSTRGPITRGPGEWSGWWRLITFKNVINLTQTDHKLAGNVWSRWVRLITMWNVINLDEIENKRNRRMIGVVEIDHI